MALQGKKLHFAGICIIVGCALLTTSGILLHSRLRAGHGPAPVLLPAQLPEELQNDLNQNFPHITGVFATPHPGVFKLLTENGTRGGYLLLEKTPESQKAMGFADTIEIAIVLTPQRRIDRVLIGKNSESPRWLKRVEENGFFTRWEGMTLAEAASTQVDAVTGATYTSSAIADGVSKCAAAYTDEVLQ